MDNTSVRERLIESGIQLFREYGYHGTGIQRIASHAGIPKGSFCFYFRSKEAFAADVIARYASGIAGNILAYEDREDLSPSDRLLAYFKDAVSSMKRGPYRGCTIGNLLAEIGDTNQELQKHLRQAWDSVVVALARLVYDAQESGGIDGAQDPHELAEHLLGGWECALVAMRAKQGTEPLELFIKRGLEPHINQTGKSRGTRNG